MDSVHHIWCPLFSQEFQDLPDGAETTLTAITRSESYLCAMKAGACRYDTEGYVTEHISQEEEAYAAERLEKIRRQNRIKAELR